MKKKFITILLTLGLVIFGMACSLTSVLREVGILPPDTAPTIVMIQTKLAVQTEEAQYTPTPSPEPTQTYTPTPVPDLEFENVSFYFDPSLASGAYGEIVPEQIPNEEEIYAFPEPAHILIHFNNYVIGTHFHTPEIRVFPAPQYREVSEGAVYNLDLLHNVLSEQLRDEEYYPLLPIVPAGQIIVAQVDFLDFENGRGVRYLTQLGQALSPANNNSIFYSFQGITNDGQYFISAILPVHHPELLNNWEDVGSDWEPYYSQEAWEEYKSQTEEAINNYPVDSFAPSLVLLDDLFRSIRISPNE
ncbi:MAG: hypothetical protein V2J07_05145 [Anaerolineae bacterium]|jgi:hypothetical protein|nr:hypothetical protein [Anaerolineae bacterium]